MTKPNQPPSFIKGDKELLEKVRTPQQIEGDRKFFREDHRQQKSHRSHLDR